VPRYGVLPATAEEEIEADRGSLEPLAKAAKDSGAPECPEEPADEQLVPGEAAKVILEIMETIGRSVLDGTLFQKPDPASEKWLREISGAGQVRPRDALVKYIRALEDQKQHEPQSCADLARLPQCDVACKAECCTKCKQQACGNGSAPGQAKCADCPLCQEKACTQLCTPHMSADGPRAFCNEDFCPGEGVHLANPHAVALEPPPPSPDNSPSQTIGILRGSSRELDDLAAALESQNLYYRADQLRDLAAQLRVEARHLQSGWAIHRAAQQAQHFAPHFAPPPPTFGAGVNSEAGLMFGVGVNSDAGLTGELMAPPRPLHDLHAEIESLKYELRKAHEALRAQQPRY
jgi:hypothetical protein